MLAGIVRLTPARPACGGARSALELSTSLSCVLFPGGHSTFRTLRDSTRPGFDGPLRLGIRVLPEHNRPGRTRFERHFAARETGGEASLPLAAAEPHLHRRHVRRWNLRFSELGPSCSLDSFAYQDA